jgi:aspartate beta-hydroxylase
MNATSVTEREAHALADAILQVSASQPPAEGMKLVDAALARAPNQPIVLNAAGSHMLRSGDARRARELYERATALDGGSKVLWLNLATACRSLNDTTAESSALEKALSVEPRYVAALLQKAELMERLHNHKAAATVYQAALDCVASGTPVSQNMAAALTHAQERVDANARELEAFLELRLASARQRHADADQQRYDACRDVFLRKRRVYTHAPKGILFPFLPAIEFFRREDFPWLDTLEAATEEIAAEALAALAGDRGSFKPYVDFPASTPMDQWAPLNHSFDWSVYNLLDDGASVTAHIEKCPKTAAVLAQLPLCDIPGYAPGAYFSVLKPRTRLPAHTGTTNTRSIVHLPLIIPEGCGFRVGSQVRTWQKGKAWVFDDTIDHEAWNDSAEVRIVLIFDIWNPLLTAAERDLVRDFTVGLGQYYGADAPNLGSR